jgi:hypothetical protein
LFKKINGDKNGGGVIAKVKANHIVPDGGSDGCAYNTLHAINQAPNQNPSVIILHFKSS